jgi:hypothetical protein
VIRGDVTVGGVTLNPGDAVSTEKAGKWEFKAGEAVEALLFDLG